MLGAVMGAMGGGGAQAPNAAAIAASPAMTVLDGAVIDGLNADEALSLIAPHLEE
jgi:hypothetical protein